MTVSRQLNCRALRDDLDEADTALRFTVDTCVNAVRQHMRDHGRVPLDNDVCAELEAAVFHYVRESEWEQRGGAAD